MEIEINQNQKENKVIRAMLKIIQRALEKKTLNKLKEPLCE